MECQSTVTIKIDKYYERKVCNFRHYRQTRKHDYFSTLPTNKSNDGNKCKSSSVSSNKYYYLNTTVKMEPI